MGIRFACHVCDHPLNIKRELAGRVGVCPQCHGRFRIPRTDAPRSLPLDASDVDVQPALPKSAAGQRSAAPRPDRGASAAAKPQSAAPQQPLAAAQVPGPRSLLDEADVQWYVRPPAGGQYGPATGDVLRGWIAENRVTPSTLVWRQGWDQWRSAREVLPELAEPAPIASLAPTAPLRSTSAAPVAAATPEGIPSVQAGAPVKLVGQAGIGQVRSARRERRRTWIVLLAVISVCLIALLIFIALR